MSDDDYTPDELDRMGLGGVPWWDRDRPSGRGDGEKAESAQDQADLWRYKAHAEWRESTAFKELCDTFRVTPLNAGPISVLADAGYDLARAAAASDADLLAIKAHGKWAKGIGPGTVAKLRAFLATTCPHCGLPLAGGG